MKRKLLVGLAVVALCTLFAVSSSGDDRDLFTSNQSIPYLFILFDVSGSMNWAPAGDEFVEGSGDDPDSKFYQAKSALYTALQHPALADVGFGFATYNQDFLTALRKHWIYSPLEAPSWTSALDYPRVGAYKIFGDNCMDDTDGNSDCDFDGNDRLGSCGSTRDIDDLESWGEVSSFPVTGDAGNLTTEEWVEQNGRKFYITYRMSSGSLGDEDITVRVTKREANSTCEFWLGGTTTDYLDYQKSFLADNSGRTLSASDASDSFVWQIDSKVDRNGNPAGFWSWNPQGDTYATNTCAGWDPNDDDAADASGGQNLRFPFTPDPPDPSGVCPTRPGDTFGRGDVIPWDWQDEKLWATSNRQEIIRRLSPNLFVNAAAEPDFRVSPYFEDHPDSLFPDNDSGRLALLSAYDETPPLIPWGATPIGNSMSDYLDWFEKWVEVAKQEECGDSTLACRSYNLLILTDGDETCYQDLPTGPAVDADGNANPCHVATDLHGEGIRTFVVGFGVQENESNFLTCIADNGGSGKLDLDGDGHPDGPGPILPGNEQDLVDALLKVVELIKQQQVSLASAAVPQAQVDSADKIFLSSFLPIQGSSVWAGRTDAYLKPVPLHEVIVQTETGPEVRIVPNRERVCGPGEEVACRLWDAAEEMLEQAATDPSSGDFNLGNGPLQRRVYHSDPTTVGVPLARQDLVIPQTDEEWDVLLEEMDICDPLELPALCSELPANRAEAQDALVFYHQIKTAPDPDNPEVLLDYILGDIFHSDPLVVANPDDFNYWVADLFGSGAMPLEDHCAASPTGYRCFYANQRFRRKVLMMGSNDASIHAVDIGTFDGTCKTSPSGGEFVDGEFTHGTGKALFSYVPQTAMPQLVELESNPSHIFTVDGPLVHGSVFIDPVHDGTPVADEREWRSVVVGGMREGGSGYFAMDVSQPDVLDHCGGIPVLPQTGLDYVPSCLDSTCSRGDDYEETLYPLMLWEFDDTEDCLLALADGSCDDDANGLRDLGFTWSKSNIGFLEVTENGEVVTKSVAVVGGGVDPANKLEPLAASGRFIYFIDIETGKAIYKRPVLGGVPTEPAAVDTDQNGILDTVYFGTTAGYLYKIDLREPADLLDLPSGARRVIDAAWDPFPVFDTGGKPIFYPPSVIFVGDLNRYAIAFGTGDREDLWNPDMEDQEGRYFMLLDQILAGVPPTLREWRREDYLVGLLPRNEGQFLEILPDGPSSSGEALISPPTGLEHGWFMRLDAAERVLTNSVAISGLTFFTTFQPKDTVDQGGELCNRGGSSRLFLVLTTSGNALSGDSRYLVIPDFVTQPFTEPGQTKNPISGGGEGETYGDITPELQVVMDALKDQLPDSCRFANYTTNLSTVRSDTGIEFLAPIPQCIIEKNWKEF